MERDEECVVSMTIKEEKATSVYKRKYTKRMSFEDLK